MFLSIRDAHTRQVQSDGLIASHAATLRALNISSVEVWLEPGGVLSHWQRPDGRPWQARTLAEALDFTRELKAHGVTVSALCLPTDFASHPEHVPWATNAVFLAQEMEAQAIRIDTATMKRELAPEQVRGIFCESIEQVLEHTEDAPLPLGIENHGAVSNNPTFLDQIFARVSDRRLGLTLDPGNFYWFGLPLDEVYAVCEHFAARARHTHFKNIAYPIELRNEPREPGYKYSEFAAPLDRGDLDIQRLIQILQRAGYVGDACIENEALDHFAKADQLQVLAEDAACLRAALGQA